MKVLILAGGFGTRLSEETELRPKPMVDIGDHPMLWHIMKLYAHHGFNEFIILLGYKGYVIKEYFANYFLHQSDVTFDMRTNEVSYHATTCEPWRVTLLDTGLETMTGGRVLRAREYVGNETFMLTYGDGVADVDLGALLDFHRAHGKAATLTAVQPEGRFGRLNIAGSGRIDDFVEKPVGDGGWINGGFFVCEPAVFDAIGEGDATIFERAPLSSLAAASELFAFKHRGFWMCMDTLRDRHALQSMWASGQAPWKLWP
jgi:glucose-1-phosphate cytidylyltransferase